MPTGHYTRKKLTLNTDLHSGLTEKKLRAKLATNEEESSHIRYVLGMSFNGVRQAKQNGMALIMDKAVQIDKQRRGAKHPKTKSMAEIAKARQHTMKLLTAVAENKVMTTKALTSAGFSARTIPSLARYGYLKLTPKGYTRTGKEFSLERD